MSTVTMPKLNVADIEMILKSAEKALPIIGAFIPGAAQYLAFVPMAEEGVELFADVQANWNNHDALCENIATHLESMAAKVRGMKDHIAAAASVAQGLTPPSTATAATFQAPTGG